MDIKATADDFWDAETARPSDGYGPSGPDAQPPRQAYQPQPHYAQQEYEEPQYGEGEEAPYEEEAPQLSEVECRLGKAQIYNQYLQSPPFEATDTLTQEVADEFAAFARYKMEKLLGIGSQAAFESPFTDFEVTVLKQLAKKIAQQAGQKDPAPETKPQQRPSGPPPMRNVPAPRPQQPRQAPRPQPRPAARPAPRPQAPAPRPAPRQPARPAQRPHQAQAKRPPQQPTTVPKDGEMIVDDNIVYKVRWMQMYNLSEYGDGVGKRLEAMRPETTLTLPNGIQVWKTAGDEVFKIIKSNLSQQQKSPEAIPFPSVSHMAALSEAQAHQASQAHSRLALKVGGLLSE